MKCFVISLLTEKKRRAHINQEFSSQAIPFEFFDATTPDLNEAETTRLQIATQDTTLSKGELSCLLSHVALLQQIVDESIPYTAIFEDDIHLGKDAGRYLCSESWIPKTAELIKVEMFNHIAKGTFLGNHKLALGAELFKLRGKHLGTAGYIISCRMAGLLLSEIRQYQPIEAIDKIMFEEMITSKKVVAYQLQPAICAQDDIINRKNSLLHSSLNDERILPAKKKLSLGLKVKREVDRMLSRRIQFK
ncbi:glycosyl transferase family 25 [Shewanella halifaxensis HAW-EB4]|uniref:Glycosyl transferase family 25 n=1 Tax=Shewanella halifaxensis (strain HAW-EB4) TaxID=458817 RepID=B0TNL0_SHEHH|nr:glycosyltransferase family 25 protein [Shewanella halifaxensis]ABZ78742.1 glycosyl transferase family 25 [Shewanella halifaxensis HAW-EB4]